MSPCTLTSPFRSALCVLVTGARGQASPQGEGGCLQAQGRLTESKAWEGDLCLKPGCSLSSVTLGTPQADRPSPISRGGEPGLLNGVTAGIRYVNLACTVALWVTVWGHDPPQARSVPEDWFSIPCWNACTPQGSPLPPPGTGRPGPFSLKPRCLHPSLLLWPLGWGHGHQSFLPSPPLQTLPWSACCLSPRTWCRAGLTPSPSLGDRPLLM